MSRISKVSDQIKDIVSIQFSGGRINDPRLQGVSITAVKITPDMRLATIYFRNYADTEIQDVEKALTGLSGFLKKKVAESTCSKRIPDIRFRYDESIDVGAHIELSLIHI